VTGAAAEGVGQCFAAGSQLIIPHVRYMCRFFPIFFILCYYDRPAKGRSACRWFSWPGFVFYFFGYKTGNYHMQARFGQAGIDRIFLFICVAWIYHIIL